MAAAARLVEAEVGLQYAAVESVRQECKQHDHVRLLDDLRLPWALWAEHHVHRNLPPLV
jgi:hypothetical protein